MTIFCTLRAAVRQPAPAGCRAAARGGSFYVDSQGNDLYIGRLTSVHACGAAIGELDLRPLDLRH